MAKLYITQPSHQRQEFFKEILPIIDGTANIIDCVKIGGLVEEISVSAMGDKQFLQGLKERRARPRQRRS
jgi:hypothetical protein